DAFGWALAASADGAVVAASARGRKANDGEVLLFDCGRAGHECTLASRLAAPDYTNSAGPRGIRIRNNFGSSVCLNADGTVLAASSIGYLHESGAVYVFTRPARAHPWTLSQRLLSPKPQPRAFFGYRVAMDAHARHIVVGADGEHQYTGAVYVFGRQNASTPFRFTHEINAEHARHEDNFGASLAMTADARTLIVGAPGANAAARVDHGLAFVYHRRPGARAAAVWELAHTLHPPAEHAAHTNHFAWSVDVSADGSRFASGAPHAYHGSGLVTLGRLSSPPVVRRAPSTASLLHDETLPPHADEL
ncbi:unnamed protein product, partial [Agarophyton chilense]